LRILIAGGWHSELHEEAVYGALRKDELESVGFREVARCDYRQGRTPDLESLDNRPEETLFVEARK
jgi:hypothetical protein